ncbi:hypothetical protein HH310_05440 [Actinoplanes sp. TBRC 11911]|uniref:hypothetical protein n=1 Tax=Actinoplanes sp. TBRC 11911 TaxID=2729386 RepID=UPI00145C90DE|nr:hypothetical protein [Actinoplanes sp. TBRC 11911]NMO50637.1 hypothetical protein [Actinoplanes sp. TBRC 11911]
MTTPEIRYRRLLALYPSDFRREYEEEMLAVLMADPRPGAAQIADVLRAALAARLRQTWSGAGAWGRAARVFQLFGVIAMLAISLRRVAAAVAGATWPGRAFHLDSVDGLRAAGWAVALAGALYGLRALGAAGAAAGLTGEIIFTARIYPDTPAVVIDRYWQLVAAVLLLAAGLVAERGPVRPRGWAWIALAGAALVAHGAVLRYGLWQAYAALPWVSVVLAGVGVARQEPETRRRMIALAVPVLATFPVERAGFAGFVEHNMRHPEALRVLGPGQWIALVLIPVAAFVVVADINRRLERGRAERR